MTMCNHFAPLLLLGTAEYLNVFRPDQLQALCAGVHQAPHHRLRHRLGVLRPALRCTWLSSFQVNLLPAYPAFCWRLEGSGYLANIFANVAPLAIGVHLFHIMLPAGAAEILLTLWLIIVGVNASK
jgi:hypothetical protein